MDDEYYSPDYRCDHPGKPALQLAAEAQGRCEQRRCWREAHPGEFTVPDDLMMRSEDYDDIARGEKLLSGAQTFEPGDAFVTRR